MSARWVLALTILSIFGAHGLVYLLMGVLPDAAVVSLGLEGARAESVAAFHTAHGTRQYHEVLADLVVLDFGTSLDGIAVADELARAVMATLPRLMLACCAIGFVSVAVALFAAADRNGLDVIASLIAFLPPYLAPFLALLLLLSVQTLLGGMAPEVWTQVLAILAIAAAPGALIAVQTSNITRRNLESDFARTLAAVGAKPLRVRLRLLHNLAAEIVPSLEKMFASMVAALLFAEPILGLGGFGTTAVRAVRRSDADLLLGVTLVIAISIGLFRIGALWVRRRYGLPL